MFKKKYRNLEFTYYDINSGEIVHSLNTRLIHITNGDYNQLVRSPVGETVNKQGRTLKIIDMKTVDEHFTKIESDMAFLNRIWYANDRTYLNTNSVKNTVTRLAKSGVTVEKHNREIEREHLCLVG
jgi:hypothetical protein